MKGYFPGNVPLFLQDMVVGSLSIKIKHSREDKTPILLRHGRDPPAAPSGEPHGGLSNCAGFPFPSFPLLFLFPQQYFLFPRLITLVFSVSHPVLWLHPLHPLFGIQKPLDFLRPFSSHQSDSLLIRAVPHHCSASKSSQLTSQLLGIKVILFSLLPMECCRDTVPFSPLYLAKEVTFPVVLLPLICQRRRSTHLNWEGSGLLQSSFSPACLQKRGAHALQSLDNTKWKESSE